MGNLHPQSAWFPCAKIKKALKSFDFKAFLMINLVLCWMQLTLTRYPSRGQGQVE